MKMSVLRVCLILGQILRNEYGTDTGIKLHWWNLACIIYCSLAFQDQSFIQSQSLNSEFVRNEVDFSKCVRFIGSFLE